MKTTDTNDRYLDCIAMKRAIQEEIAGETKGMTPGERLIHYRKLASDSPFAPLMGQHSRKARRSDRLRQTDGR